MIIMITIDKRTFPSATVIMAHNGLGLLLPVNNL